MIPLNTGRFRNRFRKLIDKANYKNMHDVLLVLGYTTDMEHPVFRARVDTACDLYDQGKAAQVIMSGCCSMKRKRRPKDTEAACMQSYAIEKGMPASVILLEEEAVDTLGNFYFSKLRYLEPCGWFDVGVVTTPGHSFRSEWLAGQILGPDFHVTSYPSSQPEGWDDETIEKSDRLNREILFETKKKLKDVAPGDHQAIAPFLGKAPPF